MIITQNRRKATEYSVPVGGTILWYGVASAVPSSWGIDSYASNVFVRGTGTGGATDTPASGFSHAHTNATPSTTGAHTHSIGGGTSGASSGGQVYYPTPNADVAESHTHSIPAGTSGSSGSHSHSLGSTNTQEVYPPYARLYWIKMITPGPIPVGAIIMLDGVIANRPTGFELCNGTGGTPDLRSKFIYGAASDGDLGATGGGSTHTHTNPATGAGGSHSHTIGLTSGNSADGDIHWASTYEGVQVAAGAHTHSINTNTDTDANHTHSVNDTQAGSNLPAYMKLYFVMRTV